MFARSLVCLFSLATSVAFAQHVGVTDAKVLVFNDDSPLLECARLRLGAISGHRYCANASSATLSLDGTRLAVIGGGNDAIATIDLTTGKQVQALQARLFGNSL